MEIIDNFLPEDQFNIIYKTMYEEYDFEWFFTDGQNYPNEPDKFMFNHVIVAIKEGINSHHFEMFDPVLKGVIFFVGMCLVRFLYVYLMNMQEFLP